MLPSCFGGGRALPADLDDDDEGPPVRKTASAPAGCCMGQLQAEGPRRRRSMLGRIARFHLDSDSATVWGEGKRRVSSVDSQASTAVSESCISWGCPEASVQKMSEGEFFEQYQLQDQVSKSIHPGVMLMFASRKSDGLHVVLKAHSKALVFGGSAAEEAKWRTAAVAQLSLPKSDRLCELLAVVETDKRFYVVMEKVDGQDLETWESRSRTQFNHTGAREVVKQVLEAVQAMHDAGFIHRDIKLENVMAQVDSKVSAKLIDFDTAVPCPQEGVIDTHAVGTHCYSAPETFAGQYSEASDMYSVGVIMYRMLTSRLPVCDKVFDAKVGDNAVDSQTMRRAHRRVAGAVIDFSALEACPEAAALCKALLAPEPAKRPSAEEALAHEWFALRGPLPQLAQAKPAPPRGKFFMFSRGK